MNTTNSSPSFGQWCPGSWVITSLSLCILISGIIGNAVVVHFVRHDLKRRKTPDRVLLLQLSVINFFGCLISLPLQYFDVVYIGRISLPLSVYNTLCFIKLFTLFFCMYTGFVTLVILCYDRYEAITKFPQQRILTYAGTVRSVCVVFVTSFIITFITFTSYILDLKNGNTLCEGLYLRAGAIESTFNKTGNTLLIVITTVVITVSSTSCFTCLFLVDHKLRHHMESVRSTLGNQSTVKEIRMVHNAFAFVLTYCCIWIPFGAARGLRSVMPDSLLISCFYLSTFTVSYSTFSLIPYVYMICDKRIGNTLVNCLRKNRVVSASQANSSNIASSSLEASTNHKENTQATYEKNKVTDNSALRCR